MDRTYNQSGRRDDQGSRSSSSSNHVAPFDERYDFPITDPDSILNPYDYALPYLNDQSVEGKAKYLHMLEEGKYIQQMQMMRYENWYNSPEQVAARQRAAGINPDLVGLQGAESATAAAPESSGVAGLTSTDIAESQIRSQKIQNIMSVVSGVAQVAGLTSQFANLALLPANKANLENNATATALDNIAKEKALFTAGAAGRLASLLTGTDSDSEFDYDGFFASDLSGVFNAYTSGHPNSQAIWQDVLSNREAIKNEALRLAKERAENQTGFAKIAGSKYYSDDVVLQSAMVGPLMDAALELEQNEIKYKQTIMDIKKKYATSLDVDSLADTANKVASSQGAEADYQNEYISSLDAEKMAAYDFLIKSNEAVKATMEKAINDNLKTIYTQNKNNVRGFSAAYLFMSGAGSSWKEYFGSAALMNLQDINTTETFYDSNGVPHVVKDGSLVPLGSPSDFDERVTFGNFK